MKIFRINPIAYPRLIPSPRYFSTPQNEEYTSTPQYPPILDLSFRKKVERKNEDVYESIKKVKTVEEKQIKLNMPRYYGFKSYVLTEDYIPYNSLNLAQHVTRTHLIVDKDLPEHYKNVAVDDQMIESIKGDVEEAVLVELEGYRKKYNIRNETLSPQEKDDLYGSLICKQITRIVLNRLANSAEHLRDVQVDYDPRIEATWCVGGMNPPKNIERIKNGVEWSKPYAKDSTDRIMVYIGSPLLTLRSQLPLPLIISPSEAENPALEVPFFQYDPRVVGTKTTHRHMANIPGFWPGDTHQFGMLSFHKRGHFHNRLHFKDNVEQKEAPHRQAILSSFCWLQAQANFLGFNTFNDVTYPLVTQTVLTNGQVWSFYAYQMNTMLLHSKHAHENAKRNVCWGVEDMKLFDSVSDGKIVNFNPEVLKMLLKFYVNAPEKRLGVNMTPYLSHEEKVAADYEDDDKREWLEREYKYLVSNRPRFKEYPEIYAWEKIYKFDNKTRFMDKRRTVFDFLKRPHLRTLDDRLPIYVPRKFRPDVPRWKNRYKNEYFP